MADLIAALVEGLGPSGAAALVSYGNAVLNQNPAD
jgi:hypothetical protein